MVTDTHNVNIRRNFVCSPLLGLTPPTTPPHKPVEDELFKPTDGGKSGSSGDGGGDSVYTPSNPHTSGGARGWPSRPHHQRKLPEQTELYAQLRRMGQAGGGDSQRSLCDHDYCALSLGESHRRNAAILDAMLHTREESEGDRDHAEKEAEDQGVEEKGKNGEEEERMETTEVVEEQTMTTSPQTDCQAADATPPASEEEAECSSASRSPSPVLHMCPDSPSSKTDSR